MSTQSIFNKSNNVRRPAVLQEVQRLHTPQKPQLLQNGFSWGVNLPCWRPPSALVCTAGWTLGFCAFLSPVQHSAHIKQCTTSSYLWVAEESDGEVAPLMSTTQCAANTNLILPSCTTKMSAHLLGARDSKCHLGFFRGFVLHVQRRIGCHGFPSCI